MSMSPLSLPVTPRRRENWVGLPGMMLTSKAIRELRASGATNRDRELHDCSSADVVLHWPISCHALAHDRCPDTRRGGTCRT